MGDRVALYQAARKAMTQAQRDEEDEMYAKECKDRMAEGDEDEWFRRAVAWDERTSKRRLYDSD